MAPAPMQVAIIHDYLTQRGGAERVVLNMVKAFPDAPVYTALYDPAGTFPEFEAADVRPLPLNNLPLLRRHHRLALPLLAPAFSRLNVDADVVICSSSGWAHGARVSGRKVVYCHTPARWLYQPDRYLRGRRGSAALVLRVLRSSLKRWDRAAAASADTYLANSTEVQRRIRTRYGIEAQLVPPPPALEPSGEQQPVEDIEPGFFLCVSRLLPYKNVASVAAAFAQMSHQRLVVVGDGPERERLAGTAPANIRFLGTVDDSRLRWLYSACAGLAAASHEDYGLTPLEAAAFGKPSVVLRWGGFLDTVIEGTTGVFFDTPSPAAITAGVIELTSRSWNEDTIRSHAHRYSEASFLARLRTIVAAEMATSASHGGSERSRPRSRGN